MTQAAGHTVRVLHEAGVYHPDLNLHNCMVRQGEESLEVFVVDFDRARAQSGALDPAAREHMLRRLERSARKLDPAGTWMSTQDLHALRDASGAGTDA